MEIGWTLLVNEVMFERWIVDDVSMVVHLVIVVSGALQALEKGARRGAELALASDATRSSAFGNGKLSKW